MRRNLTLEPCLHFGPTGPNSYLPLRIGSAAPIRLGVGCRQFLAPFGVLWFVKVTCATGPSQALPGPSCTHAPASAPTLVKANWLSNSLKPKKHPCAHQLCRVHSSNIRCYLERCRTVPELHSVMQVASAEQQQTHSAARSHYAGLSQYVRQLHGHSMRSCCCCCN